MWNYTMGNRVSRLIAVATLEATLIMTSSVSYANSSTDIENTVKISDVASASEDTESYAGSGIILEHISNLEYTYIDSSLSSNEIEITNSMDSTIDDILREKKERTSENTDVVSIIDGDTEEELIEIVTDEPSEDDGVTEIAVPEEIANAEPLDTTDFTKVRCTGYCIHGTTATGIPTRDGIVASKREWFGKHMDLYEIGPDGSVGAFIGRYDIQDTGSGFNGSIPKGTSIDVWHSTEAECYAFSAAHGDYVYMVVTD